MNEITDYKIVVKYDKSQRTYYYGNKTEMMQKYNQMQELGQVTAYEKNKVIAEYRTR